MRLRRIVSRGGLTKEAINARLDRLAGKQQDSWNNQELRRRSRAATRVWTARHSQTPIVVDVFYGDITSRSFMSSEELRDVRRAVLSPEDTLISAGGGVALALLEKAGQHQTLNELSKFQRVRHKEVVVTSGGELPVNYIFHAAATDLDHDGKSSITTADIEETMGKALKIAVALEVKAVFLPLVGAGLEAINPEASFAAMLAAVRAFAEATTSYSIQLAFVIRDEGTLSRREIGETMRATLGTDFEVR